MYSNLITNLGSQIREYTMWIFQDYSDTQILREINFSHFEAQKTAILTKWAAVNFEFLNISDIFKREIQEK